MAAELLRIDAERREHVQKLQDAQARRNAASKDIGEAMKAGDKAKAEALKAEMGAIKDFIASGEAVEREIDQRLTAALAVIPNLPLDEVPDGEDETGNVEVRRWGAPPSFDFEARQHFDIGEGLGLMDFETAAKIAGARFVVMRGQLARLERALGPVHARPPTGTNGIPSLGALLVNDAVAYGTDQLPKFADDLFRTTDGRWLIPTAEVSAHRLVREIIARGEGPSAAAHRLYALLPRGGRQRGARYARHDPPAPVLQGGARVDHHARDSRRERAGADDGCAESVLQTLGLALPRDAALHRRHRLRRAHDL